MSDTAPKDGLKKQKNKKIESAPPKIDEVVDLQTATRALVAKWGLRPSDYRELLQILKAEQIQAGFHVPGSPSIWVPIHPPYWLSLASNRFAAKKNEDTGARVHRVKLLAFRKEYFEACLDAQGGSNSISRDQVRTIVRDLSRDEGKFFDVVISKTSWGSFAEEKNIGEAPRGQSAPGSGRRELPSWKLLLASFAAYMAVEARRNPSLGSSDARKLTADVLAYAERHNPGQVFPSGVDVEVRKFLKLLAEHS